MKIGPHRIVPGLIMAAAATIPIATAVEILKGATTAGAAPTLSSSLAALPAATATPVPVATAPSASATPATAPRVKPTATTVPTMTARTYQGPVISERYGDVQASITVVGGRITDVTVSAPMDDPRSANINTQADPLLRSETLSAQNANVNTVSGATFTSQAYQQSLQAAVAQAQAAKALK